MNVALRSQKCATAIGGELGKNVFVGRSSQQARAKTAWRRLVASGGEYDGGNLAILKLTTELTITVVKPMRPSCTS